MLVYQRVGKIIHFSPLVAMIHHWLEPAMRYVERTNHALSSIRLAPSPKPGP